MATVPLLGSGPLVVLDGNGAQHDIPLNLISLGPGNTPVFAAGVSTALQSALTSALPGFLAQGFVWPAPPPPATAIFAITAVEGGTIGNAINVTFANPNVANNTIDVTVSVTQVYPGLTLATLGNVIGTTANGGSTPGLAFLSSTNPPTSMPVSGSPVSFAVPQGGSNFVAAIPSGSGASPAFTLQALNAQPDAKNLTATISAVTATSFTLTISWQKSQTAISLANGLGPLNTAFGFLLNFGPPPGGAPASNAYAPPAASTITLRGGADPVPAGQAQAAVAASATALSG